LTVEPSATWIQPSFATADSVIVHDPVSTGGVDGVFVGPEPPHPLSEIVRTTAHCRIAPI
jgi:hypothetical protein